MKFDHNWLIRILTRYRRDFIASVTFGFDGKHAWSERVNEDCVQFYFGTNREALVSTEVHWKAIGFLG